MLSNISFKELTCIFLLDNGNVNVSLAFLFLAYSELITGIIMLCLRSVQAKGKVQKLRSIFQVNFNIGRMNAKERKIQFHILSLLKKGNGITNF